MSNRIRAQIEAVSRFKVMAFLFAAPAQLLGLGLCVRMIAEISGLIGATTALCLAPLVWYFAPWYAALGRNDWLPAVLIYGSSVLAILLCGLGEWLEDRPARS